MFRDTRRKTLRNRAIFTTLGVVIMAFGIWLNYRGQEPVNETEEAANNVSVKQESTVQEENPEFDEVWEDERAESSDESSESSNEAERTDTQFTPESYLIKEVEGIVKVFLCTKDGAEELYLITSIPFDLLSESDQQLLSQGVKIETEEDLGKFLENFDS